MGPASYQHSAQALPLGYRVRERAAPEFNKFTRTNLHLTLLTILCDYLILFSSAALGRYLIVEGHLLAAMVAHPFLWYVCARQLRGLEVLLHEASHFNWCRRKSVNDVLANLLAALPVVATVRDFRRAHVLHHSQFGTGSDTDKMWLDEIGAEDLDRSSAMSLLRGVASRLPRYVLISWRGAHSSPGILVYSLIWHLVLIIIPLGLLLGFGAAAVMWLCYFLVPFLLFLPPVRLLVEASEHVYRGSGSVFEASVTTQSRALRWLLYPHGDSFHTLHHLAPGIPHHKLGEAHYYLCRRDPGTFGVYNRYRLSMLRQPVCVPTTPRRIRG